jgi:uncharacterized protein (TIGR02231 family)
VTTDAVSNWATAESGKVLRVTLYRGQALVTREVEIQAAAGAREVVVPDLPEHVVGSSLFAEGTAGVEVRAVRYRTRAVGQEPREELRQLNETIKQLSAKIEANSKTGELLAKQLNYLDQLEGFVAPTAKMELSKGVLDAKALQEVTQFTFEQRQQILTRQLENQQEARQLNEEQSLLQRRSNEMASHTSSTAREAVIFVEKQGAAAEKIRLNYLVESCGWTPSYTFRAGPERKQVSIECSALIQQMTGEDWDAVQLTLSTASPALSAAAPGLAPFPVSLAPAAQQQQQAQIDLSTQAKSILSRQKLAIDEFQNTLDLSGNIGLNWKANAAANEFQSLELMNPKSAIRALSRDAASSADGPSLSYHLPTPVSLASRSDRQIVRVLQTDLASTFHHIATPVLTSYVYREAELTNTSDQDLLGGPMTVYLNESFVGRGEIPTVARGQTFVVGFGADPQLRARRELADKTDAVQGGNRELGFQYNLVIENYKEQAVSLSVFDRLPHTDRASEVQIRLEEMKDALSDDKLYVRRERPKGILRWDIEVPANATGDQARLIQYGYTAEFDRSFVLSTVGSDSQEQQQEFEELQRARIRR